MDLGEEIEILIMKISLACLFGSDMSSITLPYKSNGDTIYLNPGTFIFKAFEEIVKRGLTLKAVLFPCTVKMLLTKSDEELYENATTI